MKKLILLQIIIVILISACIFSTGAINAVETFQNKSPEPTATFPIMPTPTNRPDYLGFVSAYEYMFYRNLDLLDFSPEIYDITVNQDDKLSTWMHIYTKCGKLKINFDGIGVYTTALFLKVLMENKEYREMETIDFVNFHYLDHDGQELGYAKFEWKDMRDFTRSDITDTEMFEKIDFYFENH